MGKRGINAIDEQSEESNVDEARDIDTLDCDSSDYDSSEEDTNEKHLIDKILLASSVSVIDKILLTNPASINEKLDLIKIDLNYYKDLEKQRPKKKKNNDFKFNEYYSHLNDYYQNSSASFFKEFKINNFINWERRHSVFAKAKPVIVILTERVKKTSGDINAAAKLITAIKKRFPNIKVQWFIRQDKDVAIDRRLLSCADDAQVIDRWHHKDYQIRVPHKKLLLKNWFNKAALVLGYPQVPADPFLVRVIQDFTAKKTDFLNCFEYDGAHESEMNENTLCTGLGKESLGVFLEDFPQTTVVEQLQKLKSSTTLWQNVDPKHYQDDRLFFFAYFNNEVERVTNHVNAQTFSAIVAAYTKQAQVKQRNLDILCNFTATEVESFDPSYLFNEDVNEINLHVGDEVKQFVNPKPTATGRTVNIVSQYSFNHDVFVDVLLLAYYCAKEAGIKPFIGCTGDQSLCEVLSVPGAFPFYQIMDWKIRFATALKNLACELIKTDTGEYLDLALYFSMVFSENRHQKSPFSIIENLAEVMSGSVGWHEKFDNSYDSAGALKLTRQSMIKVMGQHLTKSTLQVEMEDFSKLLKTEKNLYVNFLKKIENIIHQNYPDLDFEGDLSDQTAMIKCGL